MKYEWVKIASNAPFAPRDGAGAAVHRRKMWLLGGWNPGDKRHFPLICSNDVWSSTNGAEWTLEKENTFLSAGFDTGADWEGRHTAGCVVFEDRIWIVGGDANQRHYQNDVWCSEDGIHWQCVTSSVPWGPRVLHYTLVFKDRIWVMGGQTMPLYAPGGERFYKDVWSSTDGLTWECHLHNAPWHPRQYHEVAVFDSRMWVLEGWNGGNRNDVWYSADGVDWHELPGTPWLPRHAASVFVHDDALWVVAGNNMTSDVWKLARIV